MISLVIHELRDTTFLAHVELEVDGERRYLDARPSHSLNLAARQPAPIYVTRSLMAEAGRPRGLPAHVFTRCQQEASGDRPTVITHQRLVARGWRSCAGPAP